MNYKNKTVLITGSSKGIGKLLQKLYLKINITLLAYRELTP